MHAPSRISVTRRASLISLGVAGLGATMSPLATKGKNKKKPDVNKLCKPQVDQCKASFSVLCGGAGDPDCVAVLGCCESLATCEFTSFVVCLAASQ